MAVVAAHALHLRSCTVLVRYCTARTKPFVALLDELRFVVGSPVRDLDTIVVKQFVSS